ncbi:MAG TPA: TVP38/TMEM64 family protein [Alkalispirochaeta sp.]|nr:TVP38/TMEM64 family protein [Alkalispirochaeta sp.]
MSTGKLIRAGVMLAIAAVAVFVTIRYDAPALLRALLAWIDSQGITGIMVFVATYIVATVLFIPGSILTLGAGFVFGVVGGTLSVSVASTLGATAAFLVGRYVARGWVASKTSSSPRFASIDEAVGREGWKIVLLTRLSPIFPFNLLNYAYGLTGVSLPAYFFASWIGMLPGTVMYVYFGSLAANLATLGGAAEGQGAAQWVLYGLGFVATVAVTVFVTRLARRALRDTLPEETVDFEEASS